MTRTPPASPPRTSPNAERSSSSRGSLSWLSSRSSSDCGLISSVQPGPPCWRRAATAGGTDAARRCPSSTRPRRGPRLVPAGNTQAIQDAILYARVSGYLSKRYVDIGDQVKAGQLLAEIQSPEIDQQLSQARANLQQATSSWTCRRPTWSWRGRRWNATRGRTRRRRSPSWPSTSPSPRYRTAQASVAAAQATVDSNEANVRQYEAMTAFERVLAPFDGVVTQRNVDVGALITAGSPTNNTSVAPTSVTGAATGLFEVSQIDTLRVFVSIPQVFAANVKPGLAGPGQPSAAR